MAFELKEEEYRQKNILIVVGIPEATYHYHIKRLNTEEDKDLEDMISDLFYQFNERYGYKRYDIGTVEFIEKCRRRLR